MPAARKNHWRIAPVLLLAALAWAGVVQAAAWRGGPGYRTYSIGNESTPTPAPVTGGFLLSGGGDWNYDAFRWFTAHAGHGHIVVLRASGSTEAQEEFYAAVKGVTSVRTFVFSNRRAASDPRVLDAVKAADGIFIAGGDQSNYVRMWRGTPLNAALDAHVAMGRPLGGTSAGLAILGSWLYGAMDGGSITSAQALADPLGKAVTIEGHFLHNPQLAHVFTDSHFDTRERLGRLIAFLAKTSVMDPGATLAGLGVDEDSALALEVDGTARFLASAAGKHAWLVQAGAIAAPRPGVPLELAGVQVTGIGVGSTLDLNTLQVTAPAFMRTYDVIAGRMQQRPEAPADLVFVHGFVYTVDGTDSVAQAVAVRAGRIAYVGSDAGVHEFIGPQTRQIDLAGRMLMPGLIDAHMHPQSGGLRMLDCNLKYLPLTVPEFQALIQACIDRDAGAGPDDWLLVINWFEQNMQPAGIVLDHAALDGVRTSRPIRVHSSFGHSDLVNRRGLELAHITRATPDPKDGVIVRDAAGEPTGLLEDAAKELAARLMPAPTPEVNLQATKLALQAMRGQGITSFLDAYTDIETMLAYTTVQRAGELTARAHFAVLIDSVANYDAAQAVAEVLAQRQRFDQGPLQPQPSLSVDTAKLFLDGVYSAPSYTGVMLQPYFVNTGTPERPDWRPGSQRGPPPYFTQPQLDDTLVRLAAVGLNPHLHADGDGAVRQGLDAIAALRKHHPADDIRPAIAHDEIVDPDDYPRFAELNALPVLSFQWEKPAVDLNADAARYLGPVRFALAEPAGLLRLHGARVVFGSDWPVDALDEWLALQVAVTRTAVGDDASRFPGRLGIDPGLSVPEALRAITLNAAYSLRQDAVTGSIETGKFADLIVLDRNLLQVPPDQISGTQVLMTMVGGSIVFRAAGL